MKTAITTLLALLSIATAHAQQRALYDNLPDPFAIATADRKIWPNSESERFLAQQFFTDDLGYVSQITIALGRKGTGSGTIKFEIWDDLGGQPGQPGNPLGEIALDPAPNWVRGGSLIPLDHPPVKLQPDSPYHLVWDFAGVPATTDTDGFDFPVFENPAGTTGATDIWVSQPTTPGEIDGGIGWHKLASFFTEDSMYLMMGITVSEITVTNTHDAGPGSLRQAIADSQRTASSPSIPHSPDRGSCSVASNWTSVEPSPLTHPPFPKESHSMRVVPQGSFASPPAPP